MVGNKIKRLRSTTDYNARRRRRRRGWGGGGEGAASNMAVVLRLPKLNWNCNF
jgi:hypothetical protein